MIGEPECAHTVHHPEVNYLCNAAHIGDNVFNRHIKDERSCRRVDIGSVPECLY